MKKNVLYILLIISVLSLFSCKAPNGITGVIKDSATSQPIENADVKMGGNSVTSSDAGGNYSISDLPEGSYEIEVVKNGYETKKQNAGVFKKEVTNLNFNLLRISISVTKPGSTSSWVIGTQQEITWTSTVTGNLQIDLLRDGSPVLLIESTTANDGTYFWNIPTNLTSSDRYKIRITAVEYNTIFAESEFFTISTAPLPTVVTNAAANISNTTATLKGTINAKNNSCTVFVRIRNFNKLWKRSKCHTSYCYRKY
jgi:hypothetical protein